MIPETLNSRSPLIIDSWQERVEISDQTVHNPLNELELQRNLFQAVKEKSLQKQIDCLEQIGNLLLEKNLFVQSSKFLNCALHLSDDHDTHNRICQRMEQVERKFLEINHVNAMPCQGNNLESLRLWLKQVRDNCKRQLEGNESSLTVVADLTQNFQKIFRALIGLAMEVLGPPPVEWCCIGMGSMSRQEMCPFSDLEFAFLIEEYSSEALEYFRTLTRLLEIKIINFGETEFPVFIAEDDPSPTPKGFCFDNGGNVPLGGIVELIKTPADLAQTLTSKGINAHIILSNALSNTCFITGSSADLFFDYNREKRRVLKDKTTFSGEKNFEKLAFKLLRNHLEDFCPDLSKKKFDIKKELYRPFQEILVCLSLFFQLEATNSADRIDELVALNVFSREGGQNLKEALNEVLRFRIEAHLFYQREEEGLYHPSDDIPQEIHLIYLKEDQINRLESIYRTLLPFFRCAKLFFTNKVKEAFNTEVFKDNRHVIRAEVLTIAGQFEEAEKIYQEALNLDPNDLEAMVGLVSINHALARHETVLEHAMKIMPLFDKDNKDLLVEITDLTIRSHIAMGQYHEAYNLCQITLKAYQHYYDESHPFVCKAYGQLEAIAHHLGNYQEQLEYSQKHLRILQKIFDDEENAPIASALNNIGTAYTSLGRIPEALMNLNKALKIAKKEPSKKNVLAYAYDNVGSVLLIAGDFDKSLKKHQKALNLFLEFYPCKHPDIASTYNNMGAACDRLQKFEEALKYYDKALEINLAFFGPNHESVGVNYNQMGIALYQLNRDPEALNKLGEAFLILCQIYNQPHPRILVCLDSIIRCLNEQKDSHIVEEIVGHISPICIKTLGEKDPQTLALLNSGPRFLEHLQEMLVKAISTYGEMHNEVAKYHKAIGRVLMERKQFAEAEICFKASLKILQQLFGRVHLEVIDCYQTLGLITFGLRRYHESFFNVKKAFFIACDLYETQKTTVPVRDCLKSYMLLANKVMVMEEAIDQHAIADDIQNNFQSKTWEILGITDDLSGELNSYMYKLILTNRTATCTVS